MFLLILSNRVGGYEPSLLMMVFLFLLDKNLKRYTQAHEIKNSSKIPPAFKIKKGDLWRS
jgi:hypothetical protein